MSTEKELKAQIAVGTIQLKNVDVEAVKDMKDPFFFSKILDSWRIYFTCSTKLPYSYGDFINIAHAFWHYRYTSTKEKLQIEETVKRYMRMRQEFIAYKKRTRKFSF